MSENRATPLVSVIMGAYNCEDTLKRAVDSIIAQTYTNWEFLICDDCSTDRTLEILNEYHKKDSRIIVLHNKKNRRLAFSLNHCLKYSKGKYVARMDADDESLSERFQKQVVFLETHPNYDCVGSGRIIFDENGTEIVKNGSGEAQKSRLLTNTPFSHPTIMMKKSVYDELNSYTVSQATMRAEDLDLWFRFFYANHRGYILYEPLYRYQETTNDYAKRSFKAGLMTAKVYLNGYKLIGIPRYKYIYALKPIIAALVPNNIMKRIHQLAK